MDRPPPSGAPAGTKPAPTPPRRPNWALLALLAIIALAAPFIVTIPFPSRGLAAAYAGLVLVWLLLPAIVIHYRCLTVPRRLHEIESLFLRDKQTDAPDDRGRSPAWHYARLLDPDDPVEHEEARFCDEFYAIHGWNRYMLPLAAVTALSGLVAAFTALWLAGQLNLPDRPTVPPAFLMAMWGALVWSLYEIVSRRLAGDLTPAQLYESAWRLAGSIPTGYAFSLLVTESVAGMVAFAVSAFPFRDVRQMIRKAMLRKAMEQAAAADGKAPTLQGRISETIAGMSDDTIARLEELGIITCQDLAYADPVRLMIRTGVPLRLVLAWIDRALVAVYAPTYVAALGALGFPCALDLCEFYTIRCDGLRNAYPKSNGLTPSTLTEAEVAAHAAAVTALAKKLDVPESLLTDHMLRSIFSDPHTQFLIRVWFGPAESEKDM